MKKYHLILLLAILLGLTGCTGVTLIPSEMQTPAIPETQSIVEMQTVIESIIPTESPSITVTEPATEPLIQTSSGFPEYSSADFLYKYLVEDEPFRLRTEGKLDKKICFSDLGVDESYEVYVTKCGPRFFENQSEAAVFRSKETDTVFVLERDGGYFIDLPNIKSVYENGWILCYDEALKCESLWAFYFFATSFAESNLIPISGPSSNGATDDYLQDIEKYVNELDTVEPITFTIDAMLEKLRETYLRPTFHRSSTEQPIDAVPEPDIEFQDVLLSKQSFIFEGETVTFEECFETLANRSDLAYAKYFWGNAYVYMMDLDRNGEKEMVLYSRAFTPLIFHKQDGKIFAIAPDYDMGSLTGDGHFSYVEKESLATRHFLCRVESLDGEELCYEVIPYYGTAFDIGDNYAYPIDSLLSDEESVRKYVYQ